MQKQVSHFPYLIRYLNIALCFRFYFGTSFCIIWVWFGCFAVHTAELIFTFKIMTKVKVFQQLDVEMGRQLGRVRNFLPPKGGVNDLNNTLSTFIQKPLIYCMS